MAWTKSPIETEEDKLSKINAAGIINITLENLWKDCYNSLAKADYVTWNRKLDAVWLILGGDSQENGDDEKAINNIDLKIYETGSLNHKRAGFEKLDGDEQATTNLQYLLLKKKSLILRRMQNKQGKGTAYVDGDDQDWE